MDFKKTSAVGLLIILLSLTCGCQDQADPTKEKSPEANTVNASQDSTPSDTLDLSELIQNALEESEIYSEEQGFSFPNAGWGCSIEQMSAALDVTFDSTPVLAGSDSFACQSVGYTEVFGYEARVQAEGSQDQVDSLTFLMDYMEKPDAVFTALKTSIEDLCGEPARESTAAAPAKIIVWEQSSTSFTLAYTGSELKITMGTDLDTVNINPSSLTAADLENSGEYEISNVPWGSGKAETAQALGIRFHDIPLAENDTLTIYPSRDLAMILGYPAEVRAEYHTEGLTQLTFEVKTEDVETAFSCLLQELSSQYGDTYTELSSEEDQRTAYRWDSKTTPGTALELSRRIDAITLDLVQLEQ